MSRAAKYEDRYCAFIDILGFRELIDDLRTGATNFKTLRNLLREINSPIKAPKIKNPNMKVQSISDAVAISTAPTADGLVQLLYSLEDLTENLAKEGFLMRGAIVKGRLYHDKNMVFGEALVEAARLESGIVRFPRVMIARSIAEMAFRNKYWATNFESVFGEQKTALTTNIRLQMSK